MKFATAASSGDIDAIKEYLPGMDPSFWDNYSIRWASENGHLEVVELLLKDLRTDPSAMHNYAIQWACENGHKEVVKLLLQDERVDPSDKDNTAILWAWGSGYLSIVELLLQDKRVDYKAVLRGGASETLKEFIKQWENDYIAKPRLDSFAEALDLHENSPAFWGISSMAQNPLKRRITFLTLLGEIHSPERTE